MLRAKDYELLVSERNRFVKKFKKIIIDYDYRSILGDLTGYFTDENVNIDESTGTMKFSVGDYHFIIQPKIFQKSADQEMSKTNKILLRTFEDINDWSRLKRDDQPIRAIPKLDMYIYYGNKDRFEYGGVNRITYCMNGFDEELSLDDNIIGDYCRKLINYIEELESDKVGFISR